MSSVIISYAIINIVFGDGGGLHGDGHQSHHPSIHSISTCFARNIHPHQGHTPNQDQFQSNKSYAKWLEHFVKLFSNGGDQISFQSFANMLCTAVVTTTQRELNVSFIIRIFAHSYRKHMYKHSVI
eukprot:495889_1